AEIREDTRIEPSCTCRASDAGMTEPVVVCPFLCVTQNRVCFSCFLKQFFCFFVTWIAIRMILECKLAIGTLYFLVRRRARHAEDFVVIPFSAQEFIPLLKR